MVRLGSAGIWLVRVATFRRTGRTVLVANEQPGGPKVLGNEDGDRLDLLGNEWEVLHLPGHSPGSVALHDPVHGVLLAGDTLFSGSVGRVDFPTSDPSAMKRTLERLMSLPDDTVVHPGHGPATTIGRERVSNPYVLDPDALSH